MYNGRREYDFPHSIISASDTINIQANQFFGDELTLKVYAMHGGILLTKTMKHNTTERGLFVASLHNLEKGTYLIKIQYGKRTWTQLIAKK